MLPGSLGGRKVEMTWFCSGFRSAFQAPPLESPIPPQAAGLRLSAQVRLKTLVRRPHLE